MANFDMGQMEIELEFLFAAYWYDGRFNQNTFEEFAKTHEIVKVPQTYKKRLWIPCILFTECQLCGNGYALGGPEPPQELRFVLKERWPSMTAGIRNTMSFGCHYDLSYYPFDVHRCSIDILYLPTENTTGKLADLEGLYLHPREQLIRSGMPSEFSFDSASVENVCSERSFLKAQSTEHCLKYVISFHRIAAYYLMLIYTPSFIIVLISWISFWISIEVPAPRITLGLTSLLTLTTQFTNAQKDLPPVAYVKALDVWMIMCTIMVFASLVEFALAYAIKFKVKPSRPENKINEPKVFMATYNKNEVKVPALPRHFWKSEVETKKKEVNYFDSKARVIFPVIFAIFNFIYWPHYGRGGPIISHID